MSMQDYVERLNGLVLSPEIQLALGSLLNRLVQQQERLNGLELTNRRLEQQVAAAGVTDPVRIERWCKEELTRLRLTPSASEYTATEEVVGILRSFRDVDASLDKLSRENLGLRRQADTLTAEVQRLNELVRQYQLANTEGAKQLAAKTAKIASLEVEHHRFARGVLNQILKDTGLGTGTTDNPEQRVDALLRELYDLRAAAAEDLRKRELQERIKAAYKAAGDDLLALEELASKLGDKKS